MAMLNSDTATSFPKSQIEAMQSVPAARITEPRRTREVSVVGSRGWQIFRRCLHIILYYKVEGGEEWSGWMVAGWLKESLGRALTEQPLPSGRLRRSEDGGDKMEIVSNDGGCRLVEARMAMTLLEFLDFRARREEAEAELVFWREIDEQNPQFSPLFYVQVTNFECGGYSVGISCSLLLADLLVITDFLKRWADLHNNMVSKTDVPKTPIFYLPNLKPAGGAPTSTIGSNQAGSRGRSMVFKVDTKNLNLSGDELVEKVALLCINEAETKLGVKMGPTFTIFVKELSSENIKIGSHLKRGVVTEEAFKDSSGVTSASWEDLGGSEVGFHAGSKPKHISHWVNSDPGEGLLMLIPFHDEVFCGMKVIVTVPTEN